MQGLGVISIIPGFYMQVSPYIDYTFPDVRLFVRRTALPGNLGFLGSNLRFLGLEPRVLSVELWVSGVRTLDSLG